MKNKIFCVGLTGGIGSGKTTVASLFAKLGVPIVDADEIALRVTKPHTIAYREIVAHFGHGILNIDSTINRSQLRTIIFENAHEKKWLENLLHPIIRLLSCTSQSLITLSNKAASLTWGKNRR